MKKEDEAAPWAYPPLDAWLKEHDAVCNYVLQRGRSTAHPHQCVEHWSIGGVPFILVISSHRRGWEIYTSLNTNAIDASLADAIQRIRVQEAQSKKEKT